MLFFFSFLFLFFFLLLCSAMQNPVPTFKDVATACAFPCNFYPSMCPGAELEKAKEAEEKQTAAAAADAKPETVAATAAGTDVPSVATIVASENASPAAAAAASIISCPPDLSDYLGTYFDPAWGPTEVVWSDSTHSSLLMTYGNFALAPTNGTLTYQTYGGSDNFVWNIGDTEAETLVNTHVTFLRNTGANDFKDSLGGKPGHMDG